MTYRGWIGIGVALTAIVGVVLLLESPLVRDYWQKPEDVIRVLAIAPGDKVADIGAGGGYFVPYLADAVGDTGKVYAVDVETDVIDALRTRFTEDPRVVAVLGRYEDPLLDDGSIDLVLIVNTYHHIGNRDAYFARLQIDLAENGRVAIIEPDGALQGLYSLFSHDEHVSFADSVIDEMRDAGYRHVETHNMLPVQLFEVFEPIPDTGWKQGQNEGAPDMEIR